MYPSFRFSLSNCPLVEVIIVFVLISTSNRGLIPDTRVGKSFKENSSTRNNFIG